MKEKAIASSIAHWKRMIAWVETQDADCRVMHKDMTAAIHECWGGYYCALCTEYSDTCEECPLGKEGHKCPDYGSPWNDVVHTLTWGKWLVAARKMLQVLEGLK